MSKWTRPQTKNTAAKITIMRRMAGLIRLEEDGSGVDSCP